MKTKLSLILSALTLGLVSWFAIACDSKNTTAKTSSTDNHEKAKVLYVTHEPGKYHKYTPQKEAFKALAEKNGWDLTIMTGPQKEVEQKLASNPDFGKGYDVIVYNICMAHCGNLNVPYNIMAQAKKHKAQSLLIHCTLHSFWPTYKNGGGEAVHPGGDLPAQVKTTKQLLAQWKKDHPDKAFPAWPSFTGIASTGHGPRGNIEVSKVEGKHPILAKLKNYTSSDKAELYNNFVPAKETKNTESLLKGTQGKQEAIVLWEKNHEDGTKVISFTMGHDMGEWVQPEFLATVTASLNYLAEEKKKQGAKK